MRVDLQSKWGSYRRDIAREEEGLVVARVSSQKQRHLLISKEMDYVEKKNGYQLRSQVVCDKGV